MTNLIRKLEVYRLKNRLTQEELAKILEVSFATVNRWFNNKTKPSKIQVFQIESLLKKDRKG